MHVSAVLTLALLAVSAPLLRADAVPYPNVGTVPPTVSLQAAASGDVTAYLYGSDAGGTDYERLVDLTSGYTSSFLLSNHATAVGTPVDFGSVQAGDSLVFELVNSDVENNKDGQDPANTYAPFDPNAQVNSYLMASDPAYSVDGVNHAYVTAFSGSVAHGIPSGLYLGMEDLPFGASDRDYNDVEFVVTGVIPAAATPESGSLLLVGMGALGLWRVGGHRRKSPAA